MIKILLNYYVVGFVCFCFGWASCSLFSVSSRESRREEERQRKMLSEMDGKDEGNGPLKDD